MASLPLGPEVTIAGHHPCGLWAVNKPGGVRSHPNDGRPDPLALLTLPYDARREIYRESADGPGWHLLNRLDAPTSGLVLLTDSDAVAGIVRRLFAEHQVRKTYVALVAGRPRARQERWEDRLQVTKGRGGARTVRGGNQSAITDMNLMEAGSPAPGVSLLELSPVTGRTHQLRVQCALRNLPIVGDATYGDFPFNRAFASQTGSKRLFLHSFKVSLQFTWEGRKVGFRATARLPAEFSLGPP